MSLIAHTDPITATPALPPSLPPASPPTLLPLPARTWSCRAPPPRPPSPSSDSPCRPGASAGTSGVHAPSMRSWPPAAVPPWPSVPRCAGTRRPCSRPFSSWRGRGRWPWLWCLGGGKRVGGCRGGGRGSFALCPLLQLLLLLVAHEGRERGGGRRRERRGGQGGGRHLTLVVFIARCVWVGEDKKG